MRYDRIVHDIEHRSGVDNEGEASAALDATLRALAEWLPSATLQTLVEQLPERIAASLTRDTREGETSEPAADIDAFYARVAELEGVRVGFGVEHAQVVCQVLGERVDEEAHEALRQALGAVYETLFERPDRGRAAPEHGHSWLHAHERSLAAGRPGGTHPVSEAEDPLAHSGSVVRSDNPHADHKLSSARGTTSQEREHRTLSEGRPGPANPVTDDEG